MPSVTYDRFDGGLLLARPASTAPANTLSRTLNFEPQPGGWMRARPSWRRTPSQTIINNQFKGIDSNGGYLWTFGCGQQSEVTSVTPNVGVATGTNTIIYAFHNYSTNSPTNTSLLGYTKWGSGFVASFSVVDPLSTLAYQLTATSTMYGPKKMVFFDNVYIASDEASFFTSTDAVNFSKILEVSYLEVQAFNTINIGGVERLFISWQVFGDPDKRYFFLASSVANLVANFQTGSVLYGNDNGNYIILQLFTTSGGSDIQCNVNGLYRNGALVSGGYTYYVAEKSGVLCAVGTAGSIKTSIDDGVTWTSRTSGQTGELIKIITHNGLFVVVVDAGAVITSPDGIVWTARSPTFAKDVASSGSAILCVGSNDNIYKSLDAITWVLQNAAGGGSLFDFLSVAHGSSGFCAAGKRNIQAGIHLKATFSEVNAKVLYSRTGNTSSSTQITDVNMPNSGIMISLQSRIFSITDDGQNVRFSAPGSATDWTTAGQAGFLPVSQHFGSGQRAYALGAYQGKLAVFTDTSIQTWTIDPNPTAMAIDNVIEGVGTRHHNSIVSLQGDLLFESDSGVRSLTTLQNALYPTDTDVGLPIKKITPSPSQTVRLSSYGTAPACIGLAAIPFAQYWIASPDLWDVDAGSGTKYGWASWSFSRQAKLNAWSAHSAGSGAGAKINSWCTLGSTIYMRNDADGYLMQMQPDVYGDEQVGGASTPHVAEMETQWLDMKKPGLNKAITGIDFDGQQVTTVEVYSSAGGDRNGVLLDSIPVVSNQGGWTYSGEVIPVEGHGTEFKLKFIGAAGQDVQVNKMTLYYDEVGM